MGTTGGSDDFICPIRKTEIISNERIFYYTDELNDTYMEYLTVETVKSKTKSFSNLQIYQQNKTNGKRSNIKRSSKLNDNIRLQTVLKSIDSTNNKQNSVSQRGFLIHGILGESRSENTSRSLISNSENEINLKPHGYWNTQMKIKRQITPESGNTKYFLKKKKTTWSRTVWPT